MDILKLFRGGKMYVTVDGGDNSVTMSDALYKHISRSIGDEAKVFVFRLAGTKDYAFCINPKLEQETQLNDIQYNSKHKCVGFETLNPTVNRILYDYGLPAESKAKLKVEAATAGEIEYYKMLRP